MSKPIDALQKFVQDQISDLNKFENYYRENHLTHPEDFPITEDMDWEAQFLAWQTI
jgi:hypothetical protein